MDGRRLRRIEGWEQGQTGFLVSIVIADCFYCRMCGTQLTALDDGNSTTVVATLSQLTTYATILPLYLFLHLLTTPTSLGSVVTSSSKNIAEDFLVEPAELAAWAPAFALSYGLLTVLVALPSPKITSFSTHQGFMAIWTFYPIAFKILQLLLARYLFAALFTPTASSSGSSKSSAQQRATTLALLKKTYAFIAIIAGVSHIITLTLSFSTVFFPSIFTTDTVTNFSPLKVFLPVSPFYSTKVENVGQGLWVFAGWNNAVSTAAPLLWGLVQLRNATSTKRKGWEGWPVVLAKIGALSVIGGPGVAFAWCLWKRDEVVLGALDRDEKVE